MSSMFDLSGRVSLVSGAASGMGKAVALAVAEAGSDIVLADINEAGAHAVAQEIEALGRKALPVVCDIRRPKPFERCLLRSMRLLVVLIL